MNPMLRLTVANLKSFLRDRAAIFWTVAFPLIFVVIFGLIFSGEPAPASYGFADLDKSAASGELKAAFAAIDGVSLVDGTEVCQPGANQPPDDGGVLAHACGEDDHVEASERGRRRRDRAGHAVGEDSEREPRRVVVGAVQRPHGVRAREPEQA